MLEMKTPCQIAYVVPDVRVAAREHAAIFGTGPFFVVDNIPLKFCKYRGKSCEWNHSAAFAQWGDVMIEFMQENGSGDSVLNDVVPTGSGRSAIHHMAYFVNDPEKVVHELGNHGCPIAAHLELTNGIEVFMVDAISQYGHMIELYAPNPMSNEFFEMVRREAECFDGKDLIREASFA